MRRRLTAVALPLAIADDLKVGITTAENLMVPKRLALNSGAGYALAQFGIVCGMVFPVLMFPAAILYGLADLLIPEMARCNASGSRVRIRYLVWRSLRLAMFYGLTCGGILFLLSNPICLVFYNSHEAGEYLRWFSLLTPMLYCDAIIDAINKGLGKQHVCVRFNILTSAMDVAGLYLLLPTLGIKGYFISFLVSHAVNFLLSLGLLLKITGLRIPLSVPVISVAVMLLAVWGGNLMSNAVGKVIAFVILCACGLLLAGILHREDLYWLMDLSGLKKERKKRKI